MKYMYRVGKYKYKSQKQYESLLIKVEIIFLICLVLLFILRTNMANEIFYITTIIDISMLIHLLLRYLYSKKWIKNYCFNEY